MPKSPESSEKRPKRKNMSRRAFMKRAIFGTAATVVAIDTDVPQTAAGTALDAFINAREPIPADLQQPTKVRSGKRQVRVGLGDSNMAGQGDHNIPLVTRVAKDATNRGIPMTPVSEAENGSLTTALPQQARRAKARLPKDTQPEDIGAEIWTGENDIKTDSQLLIALKRISKDLLDFASWRVFFDRRKNARERLQHSLEQNAREAAKELGTQSVTFYGLSPIQYAKRVNEINPETGRTSTVSVREGSGAASKATQAVAADLIRQGTKAVVGAARTLKDEGYDVSVVDSASVITPSDYNATGDQHFGPQAAERIARKRARLFRR